MNRQQTKLFVAGRPSRQTGLSNMLLTLLISLSLTTVALGAIYATHGAQSSEMALHAQTQAEIKAMTGVQALASLLQSQGQSTVGNISSISSGTITATTGNAITFAADSNCPSSGSVTSPNYCFDITASSGGAYSTIRTTFNMTKSLGSNALAGSVFAGGLQVGGNATLQGTGQTVVILTGGQYAGSVVNNSGQTITLSDITTSAYQHTKFIQPSDLRAYSNYIYYLSGSTVICKKNNLPGISSETDCSTAEKSQVSYDSNNALWTVTANSASSGTLSSSNTLPGVIWIDGNVVVSTQTTNKNPPYQNVLTNTIIATGDINASLDSSANVNAYFYAPSFYNKTSPTTNQPAYKDAGATTNSPDFTCGAVNYPTQLCDGSGNFKSSSVFPANIANIAFLAGNNLTLGGASQKAANVYGDVISSTGSGGTGSASGKFTGTGTINLVGNIVNANESSVTQLNGNITVTLADTTVGGDNIPTYQYTAKLTALQYM